MRNQIRELVAQTSGRHTSCYWLSCFRSKTAVLANVVAGLGAQQSPTTPHAHHLCTQPTHVCLVLNSCEWETVTSDPAPYLVSTTYRSESAAASSASPAGHRPRHVATALVSLVPTLLKLLVYLTLLVLGMAAPVDIKGSIIKKFVDPMLL